MKRNEARKLKSCKISFRVDEDYLSRLDALAQQTSYSRAEVLRRNRVLSTRNDKTRGPKPAGLVRVLAHQTRAYGVIGMASSSESSSGPATSGSGGTLVSLPIQPSMPT
ncbi:MAG: ribbon-helix-helix protein, CopG family [Myxococcales bacterium]|nr:ribbon-helix-helix domain-containing protein [Deltaproteobacteria bacterium]NND27355.1 ribbon-helix-helix protein, CopG family [Myxococcales bacterium]NNE20779.1 ribbon-helix-helix protein, CopG family [Myxococcales bacterium]